MSRVVLSRYPTGQPRVVVGWDHMAMPPGAFYQEFNQEPLDGEYPDDWVEMLREGGFFEGIPLDHFREELPEDLRPLVTDAVMELLYDHSVDPDSGYHEHEIDLA